MIGENAAGGSVGFTIGLDGVTTGLAPGEGAKARVCPLSLLSNLIRSDVANVGLDQYAVHDSRIELSKGGREHQFLLPA